MSNIEQQPSASAAVTKPSFGDIPLGCIRASKTNPRKIFDDGHLQDLAKSIKLQGVAQPILVRPIEIIADVTYFEIVAGERRFRASGIAGMPTVPAIVRELSDQAAYEIQVLENLQRVDLHPLEEAEGFEVMMKTYNVTADQLAEKVGKSKAYIYASLKLCELDPKARKAFYDGLLTKSTALLVARIPVKALQIKCVAEITTTWQGVLSTRKAAEHIEANYTLNLKKATFKPSDADLCPDAGSCTACPKRAGNQPEVFSDMNADVCTDPGCFKAKGEAHVIRIKQLATANGQTVFSGAEAKKIMPSVYGDMEGYVNLDKPNYSDAKSRTWRQILGKNIPEVSLLESPHDASILQIVKVSDVAPLLKEQGIKTSAKTTDEEEAARRREKEQEQKAKLEREYRTQVFMQIHHSTLMMNLVDLDLRLVAVRLFDQLPNGTTPKKLVMSLYGWTEETFAYPDRAGKLIAAVGALTPAQLNQLIRDCVLCLDLDVNTYTATSKDSPANLLAFAARAKVDAKKIRADIDAEAKAKAEEKKRAADKKAAKAKTTAPPATAAVTEKAPGKKPAKKSAAKAEPVAAKPKSPVAAAASDSAGVSTAITHLSNAAEKAARTAAWPFPNAAPGSPGAAYAATPPAAPNATPSTKEAM